jgi:hypothetical protein
VRTRLPVAIYRRKASGLSDPRTIAGLQAWYDGADSTVMGPTSSGPGTVSNNGPVKYLGDKSGNGNHLTQTGADSVAPVFVSSSLNGKSALSFDTADRLGRSGYNAIMAGPYSLFIVCRAISPTGSPRVCGVAATHSIGAFANSNANWGFYASSGGTILSFGGTPTSPTILCITVSAGLAASLYANGTLGTSENLLAFTPLGFSLNEQSFGGASGGVSVIYECLSWSTVITDDERKAITQYLSQKWAIAVA